jgi:8-oxo-dGTP pyrophosphatase MutT (NUDIX family)
MPHIHTEEGEHDHTVSFYIVRTDTPKPSIMLHVHRKIGRLMMFGGHVETNESPWETVLHEVTEETGYLHSQLSVLQPKQRISFLAEATLHPVPLCYSTKEYPGTPKKHSHTDVTYAFVADGPPALAPEDGESTDIVVVDIDELNALPDETVVETYRTIGRAVLEQFYGSWEPLSFDQFDA